MDKLRVLVVGFGFMGQTHCGNLLKTPGVEVAGIVDQFAPVDRLNNVHGNLQTVSLTRNEVAPLAHFTSLDDALNCTKPDAAIIALPTRLHTVSTLRCLNSGVHTFVEKPLALTSKECRQMIDTAEKQHIVLAVGQVVRCVPEYRYLHETLSAGRLGKLIFLQFRRMTGFPSWGDWTNPETAQKSGGALFDLTLHDIDFTRHCFGEPQKIDAASALSREFHGNYISAVLTYPQFNVSIEGGFCTPCSYPFFCGYEAFFERGTLIADTRSGCREITDAAGEKSVVLEQSDPYADEVSAFLRSIRNPESKPVCTGGDALQTILCCEALRELIR